MHGVEVDELRLPAGAAVTLVVRDGTSFVPSRSTMLRRGDELLVVATDPVRDAAERAAAGRGPRRQARRVAGHAGRRERLVAERLVARSAPPEVKRAAGKRTAGDDRREVTAGNRTAGR